MHSHGGAFLRFLRAYRECLASPFRCNLLHTLAIVAIAGRIWPNLNYLDQVAAVLVACLLLRTAWKIAWPCIKELSDQGASPLELKEIRRIAAGVPGVMDVHKVRTRWFGNGILLDMHVLVDKDLSVE